MSDKSKEMNTDNDIIVCRCEEITLGEIREWIDRGYDSFAELRRVLRVGMGPCQGRGCREIIIREIASRVGISPNEVDMGTARPPVKPIKSGVWAKCGGDGHE